jgi:PqqD family protein of HPr-rel-A system
MICSKVSIVQTRSHILAKGQQPRWSADMELRQHWRCWDDETMVFHPKSGETHCLNSLAASVLRKLGECALTASELMDQLQSEGGDAPSVQEIEALLQQFDELGLISPLA